MDTEGNQPRSWHRALRTVTQLPRPRGHHFARSRGGHRRRYHLFPGTYHGKHRPAQRQGSPVNPQLRRSGVSSDRQTLTAAFNSEIARAVGLGLGLLAATWFTQRPLPQWTTNNPGLNLYLIQPLLWTAFAVVAWRLYRRLGDAPPFSSVLTRIAFLAGIFHLSALILSGLWFGFGDNASSGVLANYPLNAWYFTSLLMGVEMTRAYAFHAWRRVNETMAFLATVGLFAAIATPIGQWEALIDVDTVFRIGIGRYLPALVLSAVATSFVAGGGLFTSAAYLWPVLALQWLMPILPAHDWPTRALLGTALPMAGLIVARTLYEGTAEFAERYPDEEDAAEEGAEAPNERPKEPGRSWVAWLGTAIVAVLIVLFVNGAFGIRPFLLTGISMEPNFTRGDVVIIRETPIELLEVNDVIRYKQSRFDFVHRIVEISEDGDGLVFITRGDNVDRPDPPVSADRVTGKVVFAIPKIGWPSLWLRDALNQS